MRGLWLAENKRLVSFDPKIIEINSQKQNSPSPHKRRWRV
jgi:hypothetical protein